MNALPTHDRTTGEAFSEAFLAARQRAHDLQAVAARLRLDRAADGDVRAAEEAARLATDEAYQQMLEDRAEQRRVAAIKYRQEREARAIERERERLAERENAALGRILLALRDRGPLTGGEIEALQIKGASHNVVRPLLRLGVDRGVVRRRQDGKRVLWSAVPPAGLHSDA